MKKKTTKNEEKFEKLIYYNIVTVQNINRYNGLLNQIKILKTNFISYIFIKICRFLIKLVIINTTKYIIFIIQAFSLVKLWLKQGCHR